MTPNRRRRLYWVLGIVAGVAVAAGLAFQAMRSNVMFYFDPTQVVAREVKVGHRFRMGGMVEKGSFTRTPGSLEASFLVTDFRNTVKVRYAGVLPDLFREGSGVVAHGKLDADGVFIAEEVIAKHDENYMPPEVKRSLKKGEARTGP